MELCMAANCFLIVAACSHAHVRQDYDTNKYDTRSNHQKNQNPDCPRRIKRSVRTTPHFLANSPKMDDASHPMLLT